MHAQINFKDVSMEYYALHEACYKIGRCTYPQVQDFESEPGRMVTDPDFVYQLRGDTKPIIPPYAGTLLLQKGATATDFLSSAHISWAFVCTEKAEAIIKQFNYGDTDFYPVTVKHRENIYQHYKLMHCTNCYTSLIDYKKSDFRRIRIRNNTRESETYPIRDLAHLQEQRKLFFRNAYGDWTYIAPFTIRFKNGYKPTNDIFNIWPADIRTFISDPLKQAFDIARITGIQYNFDQAPVVFE
jgi:hypothetical protein